MPVAAHQLAGYVAGGPVADVAILAQACREEALTTVARSGTVEQPAGIPDAMADAEAPVDHASAVAAGGEALEPGGSCTEPLLADAEQRLMNRMNRVCDRLWDKVTRMQEEIGCLRDEVSRVVAEVVERAHATPVITTSELDERLQQQLKHINTEAEAAWAKITARLDLHETRLVSAEQGCMHAERAAAAACEQLSSECEKLATSARKCEQVKLDVLADVEGHALRAEARLAEQCGALRAELVGQLEQELAELRVSQQETWTKELDEARAEIWRMDQDNGKLTSFTASLSEHVKAMNETMSEQGQACQDLVNKHDSDLRKHVGRASEELESRVQTELKELRDVSLAATRALEGTLDERLSSARRELASEMQEVLGAARRDVAAAEERATAARERASAAQERCGETMHRTMADLQRQFEELRGGFGERLYALGDELRRVLAEGLASRRGECESAKVTLRDALAAQDVERERRVVAAERRAEDVARSLEVQLTHKLAVEVDQLRTTIVQQVDRASAEEREQRALQAAVVREQQLLRNALEEHHAVLQELSRRGAANAERLEELVAELSGTMREELTAAALSSFQGEVRLWKGLIMQGRGSSRVPANAGSA